MYLYLWIHSVIDCRIVHPCRIFGLETLLLARPPSWLFDLPRATQWSLAVVLGQEVALYSYYTLVVVTITLLSKSRHLLQMAPWGPVTPHDWHSYIILTYSSVLFSTDYFSVSQCVFVCSNMCLLHGVDVSKKSDVSGVLCWMWCIELYVLPAVQELSNCCLYLL